MTRTTVTATERWLSSQTWVMPTFSPTIALFGALAGILSSYSTRDAPLGDTRAELVSRCAMASPLSHDRRATMDVS